MNIFYLDPNPWRCAEMHLDKHVVKMPLEVAQMACTNARITAVLGPCPRAITSDERKLIKEAAQPDRALSVDERVIPYLPCHENHPCTIWMRTTFENYAWALNYAFALELEYTYRYGKPRLKACDVLRKMPGLSFPKTLGPTQPALAMPDQYKCDDPVQAYRNYYIGEKANIATWKRRSAPAWWPQ